MRFVGVFSTGLFLLFASVSLAAEDVSIDFVDGDLSLRSGTGWTELSAGSIIPGDAVVRVGDYSVAELSVAGTRILLSEAGPVYLSSVIPLAKNNPARGLFSKVGDKIGGILVASSSGATTSGAAASTHSDGPREAFGIRSVHPDLSGLGLTPSGETEKTNASPSASAIDSERGTKLLGEKRYGEAAAAFLRASRSTAGDERAHLVFLAAYAEAAGGHEPDALRLLLLIGNDDSLVADPGYVLLRGSLLMESMRYSDAHDLFSRYETSLGGATPSADVEALGALCSKVLNQ